MNEEFAFNDKTGLPLTADVSVTMRVDPTKVADIYKTYRLDFDQLRDGPVRAYVRTAIAKEASEYSSDQLYTNARQQVIIAALKDVQTHFKDSGVEINDLQWIGSIRFPDSVSKAIEAKTAADQQAQVATRQVEVVRAQADASIARAQGEATARIATAKGEAEALRVEGEAIRANPQVLQQKWIQKWTGTLPTYMVGGNPNLMMNIPSK
jgi:regulator of protease activity HflC (stomatin/prohibitin superfamily)